MAQSLAEVRRAGGSLTLLQKGRLCLAGGPWAPGQAPTWGPRGLIRPPIGNALGCIMQHFMNGTVVFYKLASF